MRACAAGWLFLAALPTPALAHAPVPGIAGFYSGLLHPVSTPAQALVLAGLGLMMSALPLPEIRAGLVAFCVSLGAALVVTGAPQDLDGALYAIACAACTLAALLPGRLALPTLLLCALAGAGLGAVSMPEAGPARDVAFTLAGTVAGALCWALLLIGGLQALRDQFPQVWATIALRVAAAWLAAIALVMLALDLTPTAATG